jgi:hypothetical protein
MIVSPAAIALLPGALIAAGVAPFRCR